MAGFVESENGMKLVFNCMEIGFESLTCFMVSIVIKVTGYAVGKY